MVHLRSPWQTTKRKIEAKDKEYYEKDDDKDRSQDINNDNDQDQVSSEELYKKNEDCVNKATIVYTELPRLEWRERN